MARKYRIYDEPAVVFHVCDFCDAQFTGHKQRWCPRCREARRMNARAFREFEDSGLVPDRFGEVERTCWHCREFFYQHVNDQKRGYCRGEECLRERNRIALRRKYERNPQVMRAAQQRRRARKAGNGVFVISAKDQARLDASTCAQCGSWDRLEEDHIIPISRGGAHSIGNLQILCRSCNRSKHNRLQVEWLVARGELDERIRPASS